MSITIPNQGISKALVVATHARTTTAASTDHHRQDGCSSNHNLVVGGAAATAAYLHSKSPEGSISKKKLPIKRFSGPVKYKECLKNHAAAIGGSATDGCGEFLAGGEEGTLEALKCSACNCHRNFHRKIHMQVAEVAAAAPRTTEHSSGGGVVRMKSIYEGEAAADGGKKRFRTKFDQEQKEKMLRFAERAGWRILKADDAEVRSLCEEIGVKRKVLKVWMHNNKHQFANKNQHN